MKHRWPPRRWWITFRRYQAIRDLIWSADKMRDCWAECDDSLKGRLWTDLHTKADDLRKAMNW